MARVRPTSRLRLRAIRRRLARRRRQRFREQVLFCLIGLLDKLDLRELTTHNPEEVISVLNFFADMIIELAIPAHH